jgi:AcrR family transcriptional regulator
MQDIADAAELSKATLYLYFESKEALLAEILNESSDSFVAYVEERLNPDDSGLAALRTLWGSYLSLFGESSDIFILTGIRNFIDASEADSPKSPLQNMLDLIARIVERGVRDGTLTPTLESGKIARTALLIATAIVDNVARLPQKDRDTRLIREELRDTFELLLRGLAADGCDKTLLTLPPE